MTSLLVLGLCLCACGGSTTGPTPAESNLGGAPSAAHSVTNGSVTVRFWFEVTPDSGAAIQPGGEFTVLTHCRRSRLEDLWLTLVFEGVGPDGALLYEPGTSADLMLGGLANRSIHLQACEVYSTTPLRGRAPFYSFGTFSQLRLRVYLRPPLATNEPALILRSTPDALVFEPVNWRQQ